MQITVCDVLVSGPASLASDQSVGSVYSQGVGLQRVHVLTLTAGVYIMWPWQPSFTSFNNIANSSKLTVSINKSVVYF